MIDFLNSSFIQAAASAFLHSLWIGLAITSLLIILTQSGAFKDSQTRYRVHFAGLVMLSCLTVVAFFIELNSARAVSGGIPINYVSNGSASQLSGSVGYDLNWQKIVVFFWLFGMIAYGCTQALGFRKLWATLKATASAPEAWELRARKLCRRMGIPASVRLATSEETSVPFVFGVFRPLIVFPANYFTQLTPHELESILLHEIAHIARNDFLFNLIQIALESFLFFNPATWWLSKQIRSHREFCCDDRVRASHTSNTYLRALYKAACLSTTPPTPAVALFHNQSELIMRVKRMSHGNEPTTSLRAIVVAAIGLICMTGLFAFQLIEDKNTAGLEVQAPNQESRFHLDEVILEVPELPEPYPIELRSRRGSHVALDTHPPSKRMLELQAEIERVTQEIEALSEQLEAEMETNVEAEVEQIEALAEQIEAMAEQQEEWVERELENSPELQRIEEITESMEETWEELEERMEEQSEELIEELEEKIEAKGEEYENYQSLSDADRNRLDLEMQKLTQQLEEEMREIHKAHEELMQNSDFKQMQEELERLHEALAHKHLEMEPVQQEMQKLHDEMMVHQREMEAKMSGRMQEFQAMIESRHEVLQRLHKALEIETRKWYKEHDINE